MKRCLILLLSACFLTGCSWFCHDEKDRQVLLMYLAGNNNLSSDGESDYQDLLRSYLPGEKEKGKIFLVYCHFSDKTPVLKRLYYDSRGVAQEEIICEYPFNTNSASSQTLAAVIADAEAAYPAQHHGLILWSHASGFLPAGYYANPKESSAPGKYLSEQAPVEDPYADLVKASGTKSFAEDHGSEMELGSLKTALSGIHFDFILFDCCLMANIEVAHELRNCCDYMLFSPTEILTDGFPYESMIEPIFTLPAKGAMVTVCKQFMDHYKAQSGVYRSATITLVEASALDQLAAACKPVFQSRQDQILTIDRSDIQPYFRFDKHWFYDIDDFMGRIADEAQYQAFAKALNNAVVYKDATEQFLSIDITHYSGLSIYIPRPGYTVLNNYYKTLSWNQATGLVQ